MEHQSLKTTLKHGVSRVIPRSVLENGKQAYYTKKNQAVLHRLEGQPLPTLTEGLRMYTYLGGSFGVGMLGGMVAAGCQSADIPLSIGAVRGDGLHGFSATPWDELIEPEGFQKNNLFVFNADCAQQLIARVGAEHLRGRYNIALWAWELPEFPDRWKGSFAPFDEVWTISDYCRMAIAAKSPVPVRTLPLAVTVCPGGEMTRRDFELPEDRFLFLSMYDVLSISQRKNPQGAIDAFLKAFGPHDRRHGLVIKVNHAEQAPRETEELRRMAQAADNIFLVEKNLPLSEVHDLIRLCDCFVSLHRAEGFGIPIAEAMLLGKPVVVTGWSGNMDFTNSHNACCVKYRPVLIGKNARPPYDAWQHWAEPDLADAAVQLRRLSEDAAFRKNIALAGQETIRTHFSPASCGQAIRKWL